MWLLNGSSGDEDSAIVKEFFGDESASYAGGNQVRAMRTCSSPPASRVMPGIVCATDHFICTELAVSRGYCVSPRHSFPTPLIALSYLPQPPQPSPYGDLPVVQDLCTSSEALVPGLSLEGHARDAFLRLLQQPGCLPSCPDAATAQAVFQTACCSPDEELAGAAYETLMNWCGLSSLASGGLSEFVAC